MKRETLVHAIGEKELKISFTDLVENADSSIIVEMDGTVLSVAVTQGAEDPSKDYFPLSVDVEERFYATGKILGGRYIRREGRPHLPAVLAARAIDRTIRPLFPDTFKNEIQIIITILALGEQSPVALGIIGTSISLENSSIPWNGPVNAVSCGLQQDTWSMFPSLSEETSAAALVCVHEGRVIMVEMEGDEVPKETVKRLFTDAEEEAQKMDTFQKTIKENRPTFEKTPIQLPDIPKEAQTYFETTILPDIKDALYQKESSLDDIKTAWMEYNKQNNPDISHGDLEYFFEQKADDLVHQTVIDEDRRVDGRGLDDIRPLFAQAGGISDSLHGVGIFYRGGTHMLGVLTLGSVDDSLMENSIWNPNGESQFFLHYNFPPFASGETGRVGTPNRRMIGHGALAEKALRPVIPSTNTFPYTIRLVSESMSSNGSTSMGSVCAGTLALMDGGVPITRPVAGISIGVMAWNGVYKTIVDIQGIEDKYGGMDFKIAGTEKGITAIQMDTKLNGVPIPTIQESVEKGYVAYTKILQTITETLTSPREQISPHAPLIEKTKVPVGHIGKVIGGGGQTIREMEAKSGASISINDSGAITLSGKRDSIAKAQKMIKEVTGNYDIGEQIEGKVVSIKDFGAFVSLNSSIDGLVHISEISPEHIENISDLLSIGDIVPVVVKERNENGKISLSIKDADPDFFSSSK